MVQYSDACASVVFDRNGVYQAERGCLHFKTRVLVMMKAVIQVGVLKDGQEIITPLTKV